MDADLSSWGLADSRLNEGAEGSRGCGGIGFLWKKSVGATPISGISSDRVGGIRIAMGEKVLSVIGVYLPCMDQGMECFGGHLIELERVVSESELLGPVVVVGDFNAHLGELGGPRGLGNPNQQGVLLFGLMERCNLSAVSLGSCASGMLHTYQSGCTKTTVDYVLMNLEAVSMRISCETIDEEDLNLSDHLPISVDVFCGEVPECGSSQESGERIDWARVKGSGEVEDYVSEVNDRLAPLLNNSYDDVDQLDREIRHVAWLLTDAAKETLATCSGKKKCWHRDDELKTLCAQGRDVKRAWREAGCPGDGVLYDQKILMRRAVRKRVRVCAAKAERMRIHRRERLFTRRGSNRFATPNRRRKTCSKLVVDGKMLNDNDSMLSVWANHFETLAKSRKEEHDGLRVLEEKVEKLADVSRENEEYILDVLFTAEEVEKEIGRLKRRKASGPDGLTQSIYRRVEVA